MAARIRLTPSSYIVLGLLEVAGESTPYDMGRGVAATVERFWSVKRAQLYKEPKRLAEAGYLSVRSEQTGRRRQFYSINDRGREALRAWLSKPRGELVALRDEGLLQLFFGAKPRPLAKHRLEQHEKQLQEIVDLLESSRESLAQGWVYAMEAGIEHERAWIRYWTQLLEETEGRRR